MVVAITSSMERAGLTARAQPGRQTIFLGRLPARWAARVLDGRLAADEASRRPPPRRPLHRTAPARPVHGSRMRCDMNQAVF